MKKYIVFTGIISIVLSGSYQLYAQAEKKELYKLIRDDSVDVNTIALYSQNVRENIFKAAAHPEVIAKLGDAQKKSNTSFKNLLAGYSKEEQQKIWDLTRYNNLISDLAAAKGKNKNVENVLKKYPAEVHDNALEYAINHHELIVAIDKVNKDFDKEFQSKISKYSADERAAFHEILNSPEALNLLDGNMHMAVQLGDIYKSNPAFLRQQFDSLNLIAAEQNARDKNDLQNEINQNPEAKKELKQSAEQYAKENGYSEKDYVNTDPKVVDHYIYVPYPYWSGYPWWYETNYWYPYPYWYHWGFYFWNDNIIWAGSPSWYFIHWHFHHHHNFYDYPHITNVYVNHYYYGPRTSVSRNSAEVNNWMRTNESSLPRDFKSNSEQRIDRIREFGKSEIDRDRVNQNNPDKNISRDDFMKQHADEYPHLKSPVVVEQPVQERINPAEEKKKQQPSGLPSKGGDKRIIDNPVITNPPVERKSEPVKERMKPATSPIKDKSQPEQRQATPVERKVTPTPTPSRQETPPVQQRKEPSKSINKRK